MIKLLFILPPLIYLPNLIDGFRLPKFGVIDCVIAVWMWKWLCEDRPARFPLALPLSCYLTLSTLSLLNAVNLLHGAMGVMQDFMWVSLFYLVVNHVTKEEIPTLLWWSVPSVIAVALIGIYQRFWGDLPFLPSLGSGGWAGDPGATFGNKNSAASYVMMVFGIPWLVGARRPIWTGGLTYFLAAFLALTSTRAVWLATAVAIALTVEHWGTTVKRIIPLAFCVGVGLAVLYFCFAPQGGPRSVVTRFQQLPQIVQDASLRNRVAMWTNAMAIVGDYPLLGIGKAQFELVYPKYSHSWMDDKGISSLIQPREAHNDYIQALVETGILGFLSILWLFWEVIKKVRGIKWGKMGEENGAVLALKFGLCAMAAEAIFAFPFQLPVSAMLFWIFLGFLCAWK